jgi:hypothetical protein
MLRGCRHEDYTIKVGRGDSELVGLTDNQLNFIPPSQKPQPASPTFCDGDTLDIMVYCFVDFSLG